MRTLSTAQTAIHQSANRSVHVRVRIDRSTPSSASGSYAYTGNFRSVAQTLSGNVHTGGVSQSTITGISTQFHRELSIGAEVTIGGTSAVVTAITDADTMVVSKNFNVDGGSPVAITQDVGSNIVDLSNYRGHNWIKSVEINQELETPVSSASITLVRQVEELSLSPLVTVSLPNLAHGVSSPVLDITNKFVIETATLGMDESPESTDWVEVFRGYIDEVDWGDDDIVLSCRDLGGKYQDWWMVAPPRDSAGNYTGYGNSPSADSPTSYDLYDIVKIILSSQNEAYATATGAHAAKYYYNNVDYYVYTESGDDSSLPGSAEVNTRACSGNVTIAQHSISLSGSSTKFTTELSVGQGITIDAAGANFSTIVDEIISDTSLKLQDACPDAGVTSETFTADEVPQYIPNKVFEITDKNLMDACQSVVQSVGWDFRFKWNDDVDNGQAEDSTPAGAFVPTMFCPHRDRVTTNVDFTFTPSIYLDLSSIAVSTARIRNHVKVHYLQHLIDRNNGNEPVADNTKYVEAENAASIAKYGRRSMILGGTEDGIGLVTSGLEAERLARLALKDLQDPEIIQDIDMPYFWPVEVGDYYEFEANNDHYSSDQYLSVYSIAHTFSLGEATTSLTCRGKPAGGLNGWLREGQATASYNGVEAPTLTVLSDASAALVANYTLSGTYTITEGDASKRVRAYNATAKSRMDEEIFPGRKVTVTYNSGGSTLTGTVTSVVRDSDYYADLSSGYSIYFTIDTAFPAITGGSATTWNDGSVAVTGGRLEMPGMGTSALLSATDPSTSSLTSAYTNVQYLGVNYYMATAAGDLVSEACREDSTPFISGGTYIGEGRRTFTATGLVPGNTYYFACNFKVLISYINIETGRCRYSQDTSPLSNVVSYIPGGLTGIHVNPNRSDMVQYNPFGDIGDWFEHITDSDTAQTNRRPPCGYNVTAGTWGTDFERDITSTYVKSGVASIKSANTASASTVFETNKFPVPANGVVRATSNIYTKLSTQWGTFTIQLMEYLSTKLVNSSVTPITLSTGGDASPSGTEGWFEMSGVAQLHANTRWCTFKITRTNTHGDLWFNDFKLVNVKPSFRVSPSAAQAVAKDTEEVLVFATETTDRGSGFTTAGSLSYYTVPEDGLYEFNSTISSTGGTPSSQILKLYKNLSSTTTGSISGGTLLAVSTVNQRATISSVLYYQTSLVTGPIEMEKGDVLFLTLEPEENVDTKNSPGYSYWAGRRID